MKPYLFFIALSCMTVPAFAGDFKFSDIPLKDGRPYYEVDIPADTNVEKHKLLHRAQLFLAEYFKKITPEIVNTDKEDIELTAYITLEYHFLVNPNLLPGRTKFTLHAVIENGSYHIHIYDFELYHQVAEAREEKTITYNGSGIMLGRNVWSRQDEIAVYKKASENDSRSISEVKAIDGKVKKLKEALAKELKKTK